MAHQNLADALSRGHGRERSFRCPVHPDRHASASVNVAKGLWYCYACGAKGTTDEIIESEGYQFLREVEEMLTHDSDPFSELWVDQYTHHQSSYWTDRDVSPEAQQHFRLGFDHDRGWPCYPMRDPTGQVLGMVYRNTTNEDESKYLYPYGVNKGQLLFNYEPYKRDYIILTEGAMDTIACWDAGYQAMGLYGTQMSMRQLILLQRTQTPRIILGLDNDDAGRRAINGWYKADGGLVPGLKMRLEAAGFEVVVPNWLGVTGKDLAEISFEERQKMLNPLHYGAL